MSIRPRFTFDCAKTVTTQEEGNAFGAKRMVSVTTERYSAIEASNLLTGFTGGLWEEVLDGNIARNLVNSLRIRVRGTTELWPDGDQIECDASKTGATISEPEEIHAYACLIKASVDTVDLVNSSTGAVIAQLPFKQPNTASEK